MTPSQVPLGIYFLNTIVFTVITWPDAHCAVLAAYGFAGFKGFRANLVFALFLSLMMIPTGWWSSPTNHHHRPGLRNTFTSLILPSVTSVFTSTLLKETFSQVDELYYARQGGRHLRHLKYLFKVMIPSAAPPSSLSPF